MNASATDLLEVLLERSERGSPSEVSSGWDLYCTVRDRGLVPAIGGDGRVAELLRELREDGCVTLHLDTNARPEPPPGVPWGNDELNRCSRIRITSTGRSDARAARKDRVDWAAAMRLSHSTDRLPDPQRAVLAEHVGSLRRALDDRPAVVIGAAKDLVESAAKVALDRQGAPIPDRPSLTNLVTLALRASPENRDVALPLARSLTASVQALAEWRNRMGAGHGRAETDDLTQAEAHLAADVALALAVYLLP